MQSPEPELYISRRTFAFWFGAAWTLGFAAFVFVPLSFDASKDFDLPFHLLFLGPSLAYLLALLMPNSRIARVVFVMLFFWTAALGSAVGVGVFVLQLPGLLGLAFGAPRGNGREDALPGAISDRQESN